MKDEVLGWKVSHKFQHSAIVKFQYRNDRKGRREIPLPWYLIVGDESISMADYLLKGSSTFIYCPPLFQNSLYDPRESCSEHKSLLSKYSRGSSDFEIFAFRSFISFFSAFKMH